MRNLPRPIRRKIKRLRNGLDGEDGVGIQGPVGPKGEKGDTGDVGPQGPSGSTRREEFFQGTTDVNGNLTFSFSAFPVVPYVSFNMFPAPNANTYIRLVSLTTTSVTFKCEARTGLSVLGLTVLSSDVTNASGVTIRARVTAV